VPCTGFAGPHLELEAGAGGAVADAWAPLLSARVGLGWQHFIPSIRVLSVVGATPQYVPGGSYSIGGSGYRGTSVFGELRLRTEVSERFQLFVALGLGLAKLSGSSDGHQETYPDEGRTSHYEQVTAGIRFLLSNRFSFSFEVGANNWNGLTRRRPNPSGGQIYERDGSLLGGIFLLSGAIAADPF
jgi:hypothetical protein